MDKRLCTDSLLKLEQRVCHLYREIDESIESHNSRAVRCRAVRFRRCLDRDSKSPRRLKEFGVDPARAVVVEDALSGVQAGRAGGFGLVIGVARQGDAEALKQNGADIVVTDLAELLR